MVEYLILNGCVSDLQWLESRVTKGLVFIDDFAFLDTLKRNSEEKL
jgi:hypothetical protein